MAADFSSRWNFHHTLWAIDGKHVAIRCLKNGGSLYFNYKGFHLIILFALVDANYKFMWVNVGVNGSSSDAQIFNQSELRSGIPYRSLQLNHFPVMTCQMPPFLIGYNAFSLCIWLMKPTVAMGFQMTREYSTTDFHVHAALWRMHLASWPIDLDVCSLL